MYIPLRCTMVYEGIRMSPSPCVPTCQVFEKCPIYHGCKLCIWLQDNMISWITRFCTKWLGMKCRIKAWTVHLLSPIISLNPPFLFVICIFKSSFSKWITLKELFYCSISSTREGRRAKRNYFLPCHLKLDAGVIYL